MEDLDHPLATRDVYTTMRRAPLSLWPPRSERTIALEYVLEKGWIKRCEDGGFHPFSAALCHIVLTDNLGHRQWMQEEY